MGMCWLGVGQVGYTMGTGIMWSLFTTVPTTFSIGLLSGFEDEVTNEGWGDRGPFVDVLLEDGAIGSFDGDPEVGVDGGAFTTHHPTILLAANFDGS